MNETNYKSKEENCCCEAQGSVVEIGNTVTDKEIDIFKRLRRINDRLNTLGRHLVGKDWCTSPDFADAESYVDNVNKNVECSALIETNLEFIMSIIM